ncbi:hypothetical protein JDV02_000450 [Purpureocillium takamizusanense]|uniref:Uncharacterized protein n=1 Tax=Purpureocillium takamizusanense TaxID=2060973 RepID=A0A9Q8Q4W0_9HYPO|nr:uncharacterized protein JDV02_000450 [Purpureocillium takamizusanense]UNI13734.1 hypothetical protein JDV02_000450 [Purpureocillium takamizusanense]
MHASTIAFFAGLATLAFASTALPAATTTATTTHPEKREGYIKTGPNRGNVYHGMKSGAGTQNHHHSRSAPDACAAGCNGDFQQCIKAGTAIQVCSSSYASCLGHNPFDRNPFEEPTTCTKALYPSPDDAPDACAAKCNGDFQQCFKDSKPMQTCVSDYTHCLGYNPFEKLPFREPTACNKKSMPEKRQTILCVHQCETTYSWCKMIHGSHCDADRIRCLDKCRPVYGRALNTRTERPEKREMGCKTICTDREILCAMFRKQDYCAEKKDKCWEKCNS